MASDLSSSKEQINEVKELLLRLINPTPQLIPQTTPLPPSPAWHQQPRSSPPSELPGQPSVTTSTGPTSNAGVVTAMPDPADNNDQGFVAHIAPVLHTGVYDGLGARGSSPSWESGDTVPVTPNTMLQNFKNQMPIGAAVSTDLSGSMGTYSNDVSNPPSGQMSPSTAHHRRQPARSNAAHSLDYPSDGEGGLNLPDGVTTRGMTVQADTPTARPPRMRFEVGLLPRFPGTAIAVNSLVFILHPDHGDTIVAEGKAGGSWKSPGSKFGKLCLEGQQMVQVHKVLKTGLPLIFSEERHPLKMLDEAAVKSSGSTIYVKWYSRLLIKKPKPGRSIK